MAKQVLLAGPRVIWKFFCVGSHMRRVHLRSRYYFAFMSGIDPQHQGNGYGGKRLRQLNDLADSAGVDCYLETAKRESVLLYEHFGYQVTSDDSIRALGDLRMWTMTRPSR